MSASHVACFRPLVAVVVLSFFLGGCSLVGDGGENRVQVDVAEILGPERVAAGAPITFDLTGFALDASVRIERRTPEGAELTVWAPEAEQSIGWCGTPPLPLLGRFQAQMPAAGAYVLRVLQPDGTVLEKRITVAG